MKVLVLGSTGMLGHVISRYFEKCGHEVLKTTRDKENPLYLDVQNDMNQLETIVKNNNPQAIINCIGILNQAAENNKALAVKVNSLLPHYIDELSNNYNFKFVHISTDCVFDGKKGEYKEDSVSDATSFYGRSKSLGEINNDKNLTLRTSIIGPDLKGTGIGLFNWFMNQKGTIKGFKNVIWTGVTTIELAKQIEVALNNNLTGLIHVVNGRKIDKYSLLNLFKESFNTDVEIIPDEEYKSDKSLSATQKFDFKVPSYEEMIQNMKEWIKENSDLYEDKYDIERIYKI